MSTKALNVALVVIVLVVGGLLVKACQPSLSPGAKCQQWAQQHDFEAFDAHHC